MIAINQKGLITTYNSKAKDMIGARRNCLHAHDLGRHEKGDIVILAFTSFGSDRGGIDKEDLKKFGIDLSHIEKGTTLLAVGQECLCAWGQASLLQLIRDYRLIVF
ncbi:MAG: hypothetical protein ACLKAK_12455 [Alkaliphilus sp.]